MNMELNQKMICHLQKQKHSMKVSIVMKRTLIEVSKMKMKQRKEDGMKTTQSMKK